MFKQWLKGLSLYDLIVLHSVNTRDLMFLLTMILSFIWGFTGVLRVALSAVVCVMTILIASTHPSVYYVSDSLKFL